MDDFISSYRLGRDPGESYEYSTVGTALLGQAIAFKAGAEYESLVEERICRPLNMNSTHITLKADERSRLASGHNFLGYAVASSYWGGLAPGAALRSTANDLLKYVSANAGLTDSKLSPLMEKTHGARAHEDVADTDIGLAWNITRQPDGTKIISMGGVTSGFVSFIGFDTVHRRGVVVLSSSQDFDVPVIGKLCLQGNVSSIEKLSTQPSSPLLRRPVAIPLDTKLLDVCAGNYEFAQEASHAAVTLTIWRERGHLVGQTWENNITPGAVDLYAESPADFFDKVIGLRLTFFSNDKGEISGVVRHFRSGAEYKGWKTK
jgi:CubicO group peptidase (beta-lactamase class C family)